MKSLLKTIAAVLLVLAGPAFVPAGEWKTITQQDFDAVINRAESFYKTEGCSMQYRITSFKSHSDKTPHDTQSGTSIFSGKNYYSDFLGVKTMQNDRYRVVVDSAAKTILLASPVDLAEYKPLMENYRVFRQYFKNIQRQEHNTGFSVAVVLDEKARAEKMVMDFDKNGFLRKNTTYMRGTIKDKNSQAPGNVYQPRLETSFFNYKKAAKADLKKYFDESIYFTTDKTGRMSPTGAYRQYTIKDTRLKK